MSDTITQANEVKLIGGLISILGAEGWNIKGVNDGEELIACNDVDEVYDVCNSVDVSSMRFVKDDREHGVMIILNNGNEGFHYISDYNYSETDDFKQAMEKYEAWAEEVENRFYGL